MHAVSACLDIGSDDYDKRATERSVEGLAESQGADHGYQAAPEVPAEPSLPVVTVALPSGDVLGPYRNALATHLQTYRRYPLLARTRHEQDTVRTPFTMRVQALMLRYATLHLPHCLCPVQSSISHNCGELCRLSRTYMSYLAPLCSVYRIT